jgi:hypothetical protein
MESTMDGQRINEYIYRDRELMLSIQSVIGRQEKKTKYKSGERERELNPYNS